MAIRWIRTGKQIGQTFKNVQRLRQILSVFAKHGFADIVYRMNLSRFLPPSVIAFAEAQGEKTIAERLRLAFEELGPTFVKLGQLLSTRSDLLPESFVTELTLLQDDVQPLAFDTIKESVERELGRPLEELYLEFSPAPLAAASIGQVHQAKLFNGKSVVVKIQRPGIDKIIETDLSLLATLAQLLEKYVPESQIISPKLIVDEFFRTLSFELDFKIESSNMKKFAANMLSIAGVVIPKVYDEFSTHKVLTLERLEGVRFNDVKALERLEIDPKKIIEIGVKVFSKSVLIDGLFHGDLHGGNLFILPGSRLGIVDFGIVGRLSQSARDQLANMVFAVLTEDYENLCYEYLELSGTDVIIDLEAFQRDITHYLAPYLGLNFKEVNLGKLLMEATKIAAKYRIQVSGDWMLVFKAILTIEGMGKSLDPQFDLLELSQGLIQDLVKNQVSFQKITREMKWIAKDVARLIKVMPRNIRWMFKKFSNNQFAIEIKSNDLKNLGEQLNLHSKRLSLSILILGLFVSGSLALQWNTTRLLAGYPLVAVIEWAGGVLFLFLFFIYWIR